MNKKAVVLLSGGVDSTTAAYEAHSQGWELHALSLIYGQKAKPELECAKKTAAKICKDHKIIDMSFMAEIWHTPLINEAINPEENCRSGDSAYVVPLRNIVFLSIAHAYAQSIGCSVVILGNQGGDLSGFPDCREETMLEFDAMINFASEDGKATTTWSPWQVLEKKDVIRRGISLGVPYEETYSCYDDEIACGVCESCQLRWQAFKDAGMTDPIPYRTNPEEIHSEEESDA